MARHILGVLGVIAAGVLLAVSAAMNYRFGFSLGKTPADGQIYGAASAAADCFKALVPFFFFAAWRNRMWSQAFAAAVVWVVVTGYSMTSALGHAALNRLDISGQRAVATADYKDMRADTKRAQDQLTWIPAHRPPETVAAELNVHKAQRLLAGDATNAPTSRARSAREYCQQFHKLSAELASGREAQKLETRIADIGTKLAKAAGGTRDGRGRSAGVRACQGDGRRARDRADGAGAVRGAADRDRIGLRHVRGLCLLAHARPRAADGRGFRVHGERGTAAHGRPDLGLAARRSRGSGGDRGLAAPAQPPATARLGANDNRTPAKRLLPDSDVQRFYREEVLATDGMSITLNDLYNSYCNWSEDQEKEPLAMPTFSREFRALGVRKEKIGGRVRYFDIALRSEQEAASEDKLAASKAA